MCLFSVARLSVNIDCFRNATPLLYLTQLILSSGTTNLRALSTQTKLNRSSTISEEMFPVIVYVLHFRIISCRFIHANVVLTGNPSTGLIGRIFDLFNDQRQMGGIQNYL